MERQGGVERIDNVDLSALLEAVVLKVGMLDCLVYQLEHGGGYLVVFVIFLKREDGFFEDLRVLEVLGGFLVADFDALDDPLRAFGEVGEVFLVVVAALASRLEHDLFFLSDRPEAPQVAHSGLAFFARDIGHILVHEVVADAVRRFRSLLLLLFGEIGFVRELFQVFDLVFHVFLHVFFSFRLLHELLQGFFRFARELFVAVVRLERLEYRREALLLRDCFDVLVVALGEFGQGFHGVFVDVFRESFVGQDAEDGFLDSRLVHFEAGLGRENGDVLEDLAAEGLDGLVGIEGLHHLGDIVADLEDFIFFGFRVQADDSSVSGQLRPDVFVCFGEDLDSFEEAVAQV